MNRNNMKKIALPVVLCCIILQVFAQTEAGIKAGVNIASVNDIGIEESDAKFFFHGGLMMNIGIGKEFLFRPELLFSGKGAKFPATTFSGPATLHLNYLSVPLMGGIKASPNLTFLVGPEFSFLLKANSIFDGEDHDVSDNFRKFDSGIAGGIACSFTSQIGAEFRYSHGFQDLSDVILTDALGNEIGRSRVGGNRVFQFSLFYLFWKNK